MRGAGRDGAGGGAVARKGNIVDPGRGVREVSGREVGTPGKGGGGAPRGRHRSPAPCGGALRGALRGGGRAGDEERRAGRG